MEIMVIVMIMVFNGDGYVLTMLYCISTMIGYLHYMTGYLHYYDWISTLL